MKLRILIAALLLSVALPLAAETFMWPGGTTGWTASSMTIAYYVDTVATADPGVTFTEDAATGNYAVAGLTDVTGTETRELLWEDPTGRLFSYSYPNRTATPQAIAWDFKYGIRVGTNTMAINDTGVDLQVDVTGLSSDPTSGTLTFSMWCANDGTAKISGKAATISNVTLESDSTYSATLSYDFVTGDTDTAGTCEGRFLLVETDLDRITLPPSRSITIRILE